MVKTKTKYATKTKDKTAVYILAMIGIVLVVGIVAAFVGSLGRTETSSSTIAGAVVSALSDASGTDQATYTKWTTCLDKGNNIKLGNHEGSSLTKREVCTGKNNKMIATVSCVLDVDGFYTYKYANAENCQAETTCSKDDGGNAVCV